MAGMAHPDLDRLYDHLVKFAQMMLSRRGEFYPFGAAIKADGQLLDFAATDGTEHPPSQPLIDLLTDDFRFRAASGSIQAAGICFDVLVAADRDAKKRDAIQCRLEHSNGEAVDVFIPYSKDPSGLVRYDDAYASKREREIFRHIPKVQ